MMMIKYDKFIEKLFKLGTESIKFYDYQKDILNDDSDFRIISKSRQIGISQTIAWEALAKALIHSNKTILIISRSERQAKEVLNYIKNAYYSISKEIRFIYRTTEESKTTIRFAMTDSRILSLPNSPSSIRGFQADDIYIDEFAHFLNDIEIWNSVAPMITRGGNITLVSTPLGKRGLFYKVWADSASGLNNFKRHEIDWKKCTDFSKERIEDIKSSMDDIQFKQEYCCEFIDEGICMFPWDMICDVVDVKLREDFLPSTNPIYFGIDFGKKIDSTVCYAVEKDSKGMITTRFIKEFKPPEYMTYESHIVEINRLINKVKPALVSIDMGQAGQRIFEELKKCHGGIIKGVDFTASVKETLIINLKMLFQDKGIVIPDNHILKTQLHTIEKFIMESGIIRYRHKKESQHDDYVWAMALACDLALKKKQSKSFIMWTHRKREIETGSTGVSY